MDESILTGPDELFDVAGAWLPTVEPAHRIVYLCRGCRHWQLDVDADDPTDFHGAEQLARMHFDECAPLRLAVDLNRWWGSAATSHREGDRVWIGDVLNRLRPLADWHHHPETETSVQTIVTCRFCTWQADAPTVALYDEWACLYALLEHRQDCRTMDTMAALIL